MLRQTKRLFSSMTKYLTAFHNSHVFTKLQSRLPPVTWRTTWGTVPFPKSWGEGSKRQGIFPEPRRLSYVEMNTAIIELTLQAPTITITTFTGISCFVLFF